MSNISPIQFSQLKRAPSRKLSMEESPYTQRKDSARLYDELRAAKVSVVRGIDNGTDKDYATHGTYCFHCGKKESDSPTGYHRDEIDDWKGTGKVLRNRGLQVPGIDLGDKNNRAAYGEWRKSKGLDVAAAHAESNENLTAPELARIARQSRGN